MVDYTITDGTLGPVTISPGAGSRKTLVTGEGVKLISIAMTVDDPKYVQLKKYTEYWDLVFWTTISDAIDISTMGKAANRNYITLSLGGWGTSITGVIMQFICDMQPGEGDLVKGILKVATVDIT